jgi:GNAT superfamily N-acetyltransferase
MSTNQSQGNIINIPHERLEEAVEILALAFEHDPAIQYLFSGVSQQAAFHYQLRELFRFACAVRFDLESPLLGYVVDNELAGVACVGAPVDKPLSDPLIKMYERLKSVIGPEAANRLEAHGQLTDRYRPEQPNYYLIVIGVHPKSQGKGYGRILLDAVHALSEADPKSTGVALDTANATLVPLYEHFRYSVIAKANLEHVDFWFMFRPNGVQRKK